VEDHFAEGKMIEVKTFGLLSEICDKRCTCEERVPLSLNGLVEVTTWSFGMESCSSIGSSTSPALSWATLVYAIIAKTPKAVSNCFKDYFIFPFNYIF
jgi:hypothetical protein